MPRPKPKTISSRKAIIPGRAPDFVMYNAKDVEKVRSCSSRSTAG
jgi:hypothetical protein